MRHLRGLVHETADGPGPGARSASPRSLDGPPVEPLAGS
jgi:hypothetical protein